MTHGSLKCVLVGVLVVLMGSFSAIAYGQAGATTSSLAGSVVDSSGAIIPGADVVAKHNATGAESRAVSDATGNFTIPALPPGAYTVTVSLMGFKTVTMPDVQLLAAVPARVKAVMEVGQLQETVVVTGATEIVQTETAAVATTLSTRQITTVPLPTRNTLDFVAALPGVNTTSTIRNSTVMGLQASATNITIDGINVQDNYLKSSDGFFARINPRMDAVEEVTVSTANPGAESAGQGAVQIRFVTRSGTNRLQGSAYWYARRPNWNSNYWFNIRDHLPNEQVKVDTFGARIGGPIRKDKLFYFFNYEEFRLPATTSRARTVLTADASNGIFTWNGGPAAGVDLLALAASKGQVSTVDPVIKQLLADVQGTLSQGTLALTGNPITRTFNFAAPSAQTRRYPTTRIDYNLTSKHRVGVSYYLQQYRSFPDTLNNYDPTYPGFPGAAGQNSDRWSVMGNWRWTVSSNMVSEMRWGATGGPVKFGDGITKSSFTASLGNMGGFALGTPIMNSPYRGTNYNERDAPNYVLEDTVSWIKGTHSIGIGASFTQINLNYANHYAAPTVSFGVDANDPANSLFTTANFPGAASSDLTNARNLYALLTGRVTQISASAYLDAGTGKYVYLGDSLQLGHEREMGFYVQDGWKAKPNLTLTYGLRYEIQLPFVATNNYYSRPLSYANVWGVSGLDASGNPNLFKPGVMTGQPTQFVLYKSGDASYNTDWNNFAPSAGAAWSPSLPEGFLRTLLGRDPVFRGGYSLTYTREGIQALSGLYSYNPGGNITATRNMSLGNLVTSTSQLPVLFSNTAALGAPTFADTPSYPLTPTTADAVNEFYPDTKTPYAHSFTASYQRQIGKNMAVDFRYVGTRMRGGWAIGGRNMNEWNLLENNFLDEFKLAQANLQANIAAGKGNTFAYTGAPGTKPLPIILAFVAGLPSSQAGDPTKYTSSIFTDSTRYTYLAVRNPQPTSLAAYLQTGNAAFAPNAIKAGLPANFFIVNPGLSTGGAWVTGRPEDSRDSRFDSVQMELRRRLSGGLLVQGSYQYVINSFTYNAYTVRLPNEYVTTSTPKHTVKVNWLYELPFGQGKKWGGGVGRLANGLIGGWSWDGNLRIQSGNILDFGNVRLVGMTDQDLQDMFQLRFSTAADGTTRVNMLPDDVVQNTIKAFSVSATSATGYSALGAPTGRYFAPVSGLSDANPTGCINAYSGFCTGGHPLHHYVTGPAFFRADMSIAKRIDLTKRVWSDIRFDILNVFNNVDFFGTTSIGGTTTSSYEVSSAYRDSSNTQDPGGRLLQLSLRISF